MVWRIYTLRLMLILTSDHQVLHRRFSFGRQCRFNSNRTCDMLIVTDGFGHDILALGAKMDAQRCGYNKFVASTKPLRLVIEYLKFPR